MAFPVIVPARMAGPPIHFKMIASEAFDLHSLESLKPHPGLAAGLEERFLRRKKFGKSLKGKIFEGTPLGGIEEAIADIVAVAREKLLHTMAGNKVDPHAAKRGVFLLYEQHWSEQELLPKRSFK